ncbi:lipid-A-disaccharide synthase [Pleurocapsales cyanobacterium LEGE 06147]|nr:lipid-A-disaccharide synthase [Pleurocapsales cyanobacterium LEGE 06147]
MQPFDIIILSNGPGEVTTWVRPVVKALRQELGSDRSIVRISVVLSPCPHSTGKEAAIALNYPEVDRVQSAEHFFSFLIWGKTADNWDWRERGVVIFLGGDQFYTLLVGKRLGYRTLVYAEWDARWYRWIDCFAAMKPEVITKIPLKYRHKFTVVGDLMTDLSQQSNLNFSLSSSSSPSIGLLPGSKPAKLMQGVPLCLAIADRIRRRKPDTNFILPVAPTIDLTTLARYADPQHNPIIARAGGASGNLIVSDDRTPFLLTADGTKVRLITQFPAHEFLCQCQLCLTTVGANTAELGSLGIPMLVLLPTQQLDAMRSWDGIPGILANLPSVGATFAKLINWFVIRQKRLFAWPNIWAKEEIVPELIGKLEAENVAEIVLDFLDRPDKLETMRQNLRKVRGESGAAKQIANLVKQQLLYKYSQLI